eukprot:TRINITY_DN11379_c2_g1_i1.p1 TRINITY_DN11379_c2_g1~~TRINITY_DN11379_c2_g1_i1.p1  ORF type:complete len:622 (+),score=229.74 TRINITY_DN11379_c2_g1_i1:33-1868(+)
MAADTQGRKKGDQKKKRAQTHIHTHATEMLPAATRVPAAAAALVSACVVGRRRPAAARRPSQATRRAAAVRCVDRTRWGQRRWVGQSTELLTQCVLRSVVKVYATASRPNYFLPWQRRYQHHSTGSGFVADLGRRLLLTNAHVVLDATFIEVRRESDSEKFSARAVYVGMDCDLALLTVDDDEFWRDLSALPIFTDQAADSADLEHVVQGIGPFDGLPDIQHNVRVVGYPVGGDQVSVTSGVVSRVDNVPYAISNETHLLAIQIDAAINPGNSGGPALVGNRVVGVSFQSLRNTDNISYIVPIPVVAHFLRQFYASRGAAADGDRVGVTDVPQYGHPFYHPGFCTLGVLLQEPVNEYLRADLGLTKEQRGILVQKVLNGAAVEGKVLANDVILAVDGVPIANNGTVVASRPNVRVKFTHILNMKGYREDMLVRLVRDKKEMEVTISSGVLPAFVKSHLYNPYFHQKPKYVMLGGLVFTPLTVSYLMEWNDWYNAAPRHLVNLSTWGQQSEEADEAVILSQILPHAVNKGYLADEFNNRVVGKLNGKPVKNLHHLSDMIDELAGKDDAGERSACFDMMFGSAPLRLTVNVGKAVEADEEIRALYNVPASKFL